jgi:hypothetical protein
MFFGRGKRESFGRHDLWEVINFYYEDELARVGENFVGSAAGVALFHCALGGVIRISWTSGCVSHLSGE